MIMKRLAHLLAIPFLWLWQERKGVLFVASLGAVAVGFALERVSLGLIVPGSVVLCGLIAQQFRSPELPTVQQRETENESS